jgi:choline dehydrogenase
MNFPINIKAGRSAGGAPAINRLSTATGAVSDELKVHGLQNLRVIDASVMPKMPSDNTYSATMVIAEKGSDLIRGKAASTPAALPA